MNHLTEAFQLVANAMTLLEDLWATVPESRTPRLQDVTNLLERAKGKIFKEAKGRPCSDEEAKEALEQFFERVEANKKDPHKCALCGMRWLTDKNKCVRCGAGLDYRTRIRETTDTTGTTS